MKKWTLDVKTNEFGDAIIELPKDFLQNVGWKEGDHIKWNDRGDGSWTMTKIETQYELVECISTFRHRYVVEVPVGTDDLGNNKSTWALDTVVCEDAVEFSQQHISENIVSSRTISRDEILTLCDEDNSYCRSWPEDKKIETFVTEWKDYDAT